MHRYEKVHDVVQGALSGVLLSQLRVDRSVAILVKERGCIAVVFYEGQQVSELGNCIWSFVGRSVLSFAFLLSVSFVI